MRVPLFTDHPFEAEVAVVHFRLQATQAVRHVPADAALDVLVALRFGQTMLVNLVFDAAWWSGGFIPVELDLATLDRAGAVDRSRLWQVQHGKILNAEGA